MGFCDALLITTIAKITPEQSLFVQSIYSVTVLFNLTNYVLTDEIF